MCFSDVLDGIEPLLDLDPERAPDVARDDVPLSQALPSSDSQHSTQLPGIAEDELSDGDPVPRDRVPGLETAASSNVCNLTNFEFAPCLSEGTSHLVEQLPPKVGLL